MQVDPVVAKELHRRRAAALKLAAADGAAASLVTGRADVRYLSGFTGTNGWLLLHPEESILVTDPRYGAQAATEAVGCRVHVTDRGLPGGVAELELPPGEIGFQPGRLTVAALRELEEALPERQWVDDGGALVALRGRKGPEEVAAIQRALALAEAVLREVAPEIRAGRTEGEVAALLEYRCRCRGAERMAFQTIVAAGDHASLPHARPRDRRLSGGDVVLVDMGCVVDGYCSDVTRMLALGSVPPEWRAWHAAVDAAVDAALDATRPGVPCAEVDAAARRRLGEAGLQEAFVHGLGHGVGLEVHEAPRLSSRSDDVVEEDMVFTIEPGVYLPGRGGVRIEEMVLVGAEGARRLNELSRDFLTAGSRAR